MDHQFLSTEAQSYARYKHLWGIFFASVRAKMHFVVYSIRIEYVFFAV